MYESRSLLKPIDFDFLSGFVTSILKLSSCFVEGCKDTLQVGERPDGSWILLRRIDVNLFV